MSEFAVVSDNPFHLRTHGLKIGRRERDYYFFLEMSFFPLCFRCLNRRAKETCINRSKRSKKDWPDWVTLGTQGSEVQNVIAVFLGCSHLISCLCFDCSDEYCHKTIKTCIRPEMIPDPK